MMQPHRFVPLFCAATLSATVLVFQPGCSSTTTASQPARGAMTGATVGAIGGTVVSSATGGNPSQGLLVGGAAGAVVGGLIGLSQEMAERREQDRVSQERAHQQDLARRRAQEARMRATLEEELAVAEGFRITEAELREMQTRAAALENRLKELQAERMAAMQRKQSLDEAEKRIASAEAMIAQLEQELAELSGNSFGNNQ